MLAANIVKFPHAFILWPSSVSFTLAYPYIILLVSLCIPTVSVSELGVADSHPAALRVQQTIFATDSSVFGPEFMGSIAPLLDSLEPNLDAYYDNSSDTIDLGRIQSSHLLSYRDLGRPTKLPLKLDRPLETLLDTLFYHPKVRNGMLVDAEGLILTLVERTDEPSPAHEAWQRILHSPSHQRKLTPSRHRVQRLSEPFGKSLLGLLYESQRSVSHRLGEITLFGAYLLLFVYIILSLSNITSVRSRFGLFVSFCVQCALSVLSACTLISLFVPAFVPRSTHCFVLFPFSVVVIGTGNMFRLVNAVSRTPEENHPFTRLKTALLASAPLTIKQVAVDVSIFVLASAASYSHFPQASMVFLASALAVLIDLALHFTYFLSVLSVDVRRVELEDLISTELPIDRFEESSSDDGRRLKLHQRAFVYLHPSFHNIKLPYTTQTTTAVFIVLYIAAILVGLPPSRYGVDSVALFTPDLIKSVVSQSVDVISPLIVRKYGSSATAAFLYSDGDVLSYLPSVRISFALEFVASLTFILSLTGIILKVILPPEPDAIDEVPVSENQFFAKDLIGYHMLDILQIYTQGSHVLTVSMDRKVFLWNAVAIGSGRGTLVDKPVSIPVHRKYWPLHSCELNTSHQLVAMFSKSHSAVIVFNYRIGQVVTCLESPLFRHKPVLAFFRNTDLLVVTTCGYLVVVHTSDVDAGTIAATRVPVDMLTKSITAGPGPVPDQLHLHHHTIIWASRINTPRMMERIVMASASNKIFIVSPMRKKWIFRVLDLQEMGAHPTPSPMNMRMGHHMMGGGGASRQFQLPSDMVELVALPQLNMLLIGINLEALLVDLQTGTVVKRMHVGHYKRGTLRAFHSNPIHCRFCGSTSIESISVAYSDYETPGLVICHTVTLDSRSKSNICLRVERDPREIRCLSFEASQEKQHWMSNVEGWETTGINMIMGVSRKQQPNEADTGVGDHEIISYNDPVRDTSLFGTSASPYQTPDSVYSRLNAMSSHNKRQLSSVIEKRPPLAVTWEGWIMSASGKVSYYDIPETSLINQTRNNQSDSGDCSQTVPGVGLATHLPMGRLLIGSVGPVTRYGTKSIAVVFGNIIKILYFGNEESFVDELTPNETASMPGTPLLAPKKWRRVSMNSVNTMN
ncbi:Sterol regulatory element-binding protein cleavage-activating protein [Yarrowia sp. B02]|nr:Sterol regulatory element-binding protein cleavage-activating protein [Yarrowia sp. B02]